MNVARKTQPKLQILRQPHQYVHRTQQNSPIDSTRKKTKYSQPKQFTMPLVNKEALPSAIYGANSKIIKSVHNSKQKSYRNHHKGPIFDVNVLKNFGGSFDKETFLQYETSKLRRNIPQTNRVITQKKVIATEGNDKQASTERDKRITKSKITFKLNNKRGSYNNESTQKSPKSKRPDTKILSFPKSQKLTIIDKELQSGVKHKLEKKLTPFEKQEVQTYQIYYIGPRRIYTKSDFTDGEGDPKVMVHDAIAYRYQIISMFGKGSFGKVFKAFDHKKKQFVALKLIKAQKKFVTQAKVQIEILQTALLKDPKLRSNIVKMKGSFVFRGHSCITFEMLHKNLYQFLKQHHFSGFSQDLIRRFAIQILQSLFFFKSNSIIHCDLKPENIMLKQENKSGIKVIDVGSGCFEHKQIYTYIQSRFYRAPEIILGVRYTSAIDMWSFGCIIAELYNGFPLFPGESENQQMLMFMELRGLPPKHLIKISQRRKKFFDDNFELRIPQQKGKQKLPNTVQLSEVIGSEDEDFLNLIERCLQWDPEKRIKPEEALLHQWVLKGLPEDIRQQHAEQMKQQMNLQ